MLSASPVISQEELNQFAWGVSPQWDVECDHLLHAAVSQLTDRKEPHNHVVLILDKVGLIPMKSQVKLKRTLCQCCAFCWFCEKM